MISAMTTREETLTLSSGHTLWTKQFDDTLGNTGQTPLLALHGGPGAGHDYLEPLTTLADMRPVILYDQLGCGKSDQPDDKTLWTIDRFVAEIDEVRAQLHLDTVHLYGHSWGGWLGLEYLLSNPTGVQSLTLASTSASIAQFVGEAERLKSELPDDVQAVMATHEAAEDYHHPDYEAAVGVFYARHLCRLPEWPDAFLRSVANLDGNQVYETMNGPNEFTVIGNLQGWDQTDRLAGIAVPTLITVGRFDELTPACAETLHAGLPQSELVIFENSSHTAHFEEQEHYLSTLSSFLQKVDEIA